MFQNIDRTIKSCNSKYSITNYARVFNIENKKRAANAALQYDPQISTCLQIGFELLGLWCLDNIFAVLYKFA